MRRPFAAPLATILGLSLTAGTLIGCQMINKAKGLYALMHELDEHLEEDLAVTTLAKLAGMSVRTFTRRFRDALGLFATALYGAVVGTVVAVLVAVNDEDSRAESMRIAAALRRRGVPTLVSPKAAKFGKQIQFADRRGIPYVWFPGAGETGDQIKDIRSGEQFDADATSWVLPAADEQVRLEVAEASPAS